MQVVKKSSPYLVFVAKGACEANYISAILSHNDMLIRLRILETLIPEDLSF